MNRLQINRLQINRLNIDRLKMYFSCKKLSQGNDNDFFQIF